MQIDCQTFFISCVCSFDGGQHEQGTGGRISGPGNSTKITKTTDKGRPHTGGTRQQHHPQDKTQGEHSTTQVHRHLLQNHHHLYCAHHDLDSTLLPSPFPNACPDAPCSTSRQFPPLNQHRNGSTVGPTKARRTQKHRPANRRRKRVGNVVGRVRLRANGANGADEAVQP